MTESENTVVASTNGWDTVYGIRFSVNGGVISGHWGGAKVVQFMLRLGA